MGITDFKSIDWANPEAMISKHFSVHEALYLPSWARQATEADGLNESVKAEISRLALLVDIVCDRLEIKPVVHCWYRPRGYNKEVGGAKNSSHLSEGPWSAIDFSAAVPGCDSRGKSCDLLRAKILPMLEELGLRMEKNGKDAPWIHLDSKPPIFTRYFRP